MSDISVTFKTELINQQDIITKNDGILLMGTSTDGPVMEVVQVYDMLMMVDIYESGELVKAYYEAKLSGTDNIYVVRITGTKSEVTMFSTLDEELIRIESVHGGSKYNQNKVTVVNNSIIIDYVFGLTSGSKTFTYCAESIEEICYAINSYTYLHGCKAKAVKLGFYTLKDSIYDLSGGTNETILTGREREAALNNAYEIIKNSTRKFSIVVPLKATLNDARIDFISPLNKMCEERSSFMISTIGVIGAEAGNYVSMFNRVTRNDMSPYLNTVCIYSRPKISSGLYDFDSMQSGSTNMYTSDTPEAMFAGMISVTPKTFSINNKVAPIITETMLLSTEEKIALAALGINTIDYIIGRGYCVRGGKTLSYNSELSPINNIRLILYIQDNIRAITETGIGEDIKMFANKESEINIFMGDLVSARVIKNYNVIVTYVGTDSVEIHGDVTPIGSIKAIAIDVTMIIKRY
jgi:hypothetical protein